MPELPEVETVVRTLRPALLGKTIRAVELLRNDILFPVGTDLPALLGGRTVVSIDRRGKKILIRVDSGQCLCVHLGMTGRLTIEPGDAPVRKHTHLRLDLGSAELRFCDPRRFGGIWWLGCDDSPANGLGPEPLTLRPAQLARTLARTRRAIKTALLDQSLIAGLGNIYADESLFLAGIHPLTPANRLTPEQIRGLSRAIKLTLRRAIRHGGSTLRDYVDVNGQSGRYQNRHRAYARTGLPCSRCRTPIERIVLSGRSTHFCPTCQAPFPAP